MILCPRCERNSYTPYGETMGPNDPPFPALSRYDNETYICSDCGTAEALLGFRGQPLTGPEDWPIDTSGLPDGAHRSTTDVLDEPISDLLFPQVRPPR